MNPCFAHKKNLSLLAAGVLEAAERARLQRHLLECPGCKQYWREMSGLCGEFSRVAESLPLIETSGDFHRRLNRKIQSLDRVSPRGTLARFFDRLLVSRLETGLAATVAMILVIAGLQFQSKVEKMDTNSEKPKPNADKFVVDESRPTWIAYRMAARKSLETLDVMLTREAAQSTHPPNLVTAFMREAVGLTD